MQTHQYTQKELQNFLASPHPQQFMLLYEVYSAPIYTVLLEIFSTESLAQHVLGAAFLKIYENRAGYNPAISAVFPWMLRTAIAVALQYTDNKELAAKKLKKAFINMATAS